MFIVNLKQYLIDSLFIRIIILNLTNVLKFNCHFRKLIDFQFDCFLQKFIMIFLSALYDYHDDLCGYFNLYSQLGKSKCEYLTRIKDTRKSLAS